MVSIYDDINPIKKESAKVSLYDELELPVPHSSNINTGQSMHPSSNIRSNPQPNIMNVSSSNYHHHQAPPSNNNTMSIPMPHISNISHQNNNNNNNNNNNMSSMPLSMTYNNPDRSRAHPHHHSIPSHVDPSLTGIPLQHLSSYTSSILYVGGISWWITDADIRKTFDQFANIKSIKIHADKVNGKSKGYGYVEFDIADIDLVKLAKDKLNGLLLNGCTLNVTFASPEKIKSAEYTNTVVHIPKHKLNIHSHHHKRPNNQSHSHSHSTHHLPIKNIQHIIGNNPINALNALTQRRNIMSNNKSNINNKQIDNKSVSNTANILSKFTNQGLISALLNKNKNKTKNKIKSTSRSRSNTGADSTASRSRSGSRSRSRSSKHRRHRHRDGGGKVSKSSRNRSDRDRDRNRDKRRERNNNIVNNDGIDREREKKRRHRHRHRREGGSSRHGHRSRKRKSDEDDPKLQSDNNNKEEVENITVFPEDLNKTNNDDKTNVEVQ